jgi:tetratricopeptide (TPR) repeat protein
MLMQLAEIKQILSENAYDVRGLFFRDAFWQSENSVLISACNFLRRSKACDQALILMEKMKENRCRFQPAEWIKLLYLNGDLCHDLDRYSEAVKCYSEILEFGESDMAFNNRALAYWELGHYDKALSDYKRSTQLNPGNVTSYRGAGEMLLRLGRPADAILQFEIALRIDGDYEGASDGLLRAQTELSKMAS